MDAAPVSAAADNADIAEPAQGEWARFKSDSGTRAIRREEMPQIKAEHRGALVNFLKGRGIEHETTEVDPRTLKPTQAEFSPAKVAKAREYTGGDRSIIVSSDGHVVDGHHQWLARRESGDPIKVIRLDKPIDEVLPAVREFPSAEASEGQPSGQDSQKGVAPRTAEAGDAPAAPSPDAAGSTSGSAGGKGTTPKTKSPAAPQIDDFGKKIGGARKDIWAGRRLEVSDLDKLDDVDLKVLVKKDQIFPTPEYETMVDRYAKEVAALLERRKSQPADSGSLAERVLAQRLERVNPAEVAAGMAYWVKRVRDSIQQPNEAWSREQYARYVEAVGKVRTYLDGLTLVDFGRGQIEHLQSMFGDGTVVNRRLVSTSDGAKFLSALGRRFFQQLGSSVDRAVRDARRTGFPKKQEGTKLADRLEVYGAGDQWRITWRVGQRRLQVKGDFKSQGEARAYLEQNRDQLLDQVSNKEPVRPMLDGISRVGEDYRQGKPATAQMFQEAFGFRGVEFGNWLSVGDRQASLNHAYDALQDLARVIGVPTKAISLNGELGLAFGARGRSGALAHYEPRRVVINLSKMNGAGSLAHEWGHALDNYFARAFEGGSGRFVSDGFTALSTVRPEVKSAWRGVMNALMTAEQDSSNEQFRATASNYLKNARELDKFRGGSYWATRLEMFARAFESYVQDKAGQSDYLVNSTEEGSTYNPMGYPRGNERAAIAKAFDKLFETIETRETDQGVAMFRLDGPGLGMSREQAQQVVDEVTSAWTNGPRIFVLDSMTDPRAPKAARDSYARLVANGAKGAPRGFITRDGAVYVVASQNPDRAAIVRTVLHEAAGHYGLRGVFGAELQGVLQEVAMRRREDVQRKMRQYGFRAGEELRAAEEVLAEMAETNPQIGFVRRAMAAIRTFLRKLGVDLALTDDEIVTNFILPARQYVQQGADRAPTVDAVPVAASLSEGWVDKAQRRMAKLVDEWATGRVKPADSIVLGNTPPVLRAIGIPDLQVDVTGAVLAKTQGGRHKEEGITPEQLKMLPRQLYDPLAVFESDTSRDGFVIVTELRTRLGDPVVAALHVGRNAGRLVVNRIASVYGKEDAAAKFAEWAGKGRLRYLRNEESLGPSTTIPRSSVGEVVQAARSSGVQFKVRSDVPQLADEAEFSLSGVADTAENAASFDAPAPSWLDDLIYSLQDKQIDLRRIQQAITKTGKTIADAIDPYLQEELFYGRAAKQTQDFLDAELKPLLKDMAARGVAMNDLEAYLHARHAPEANRVLAERNPGSADGLAGMATADAEAYMRGLDPKRRADLEALAGAVDTMVRESRQLLVSYGLESQETVDAWAKTHQHYVPLMREDTDGAPGTGQGFSVRGSSTKARTGSERKVVDILANIAMQRERAIVRGEKNRVANAMIGMAEAFPNADLWKVDQPPTERVIDDRTGLVTTRIDPLYKSRDNVITARVPTPDGVKERVLVLDPSNARAVRMAQALKNLDMDQLGKVLGASAKVTRYLASVNTQYNPVFGIVNLVRDAQSALFNLSATPIAGKQAEVAKNLLSALRGIYSDARKVCAGGAADSEWSREWEEFQKVGGQTGYRDMFRTSKDRAEAIEDEINRAAKGDPLKAGRAIFDWLSDYNLAMENAVRLSAYRTAKASGLSNERAASIAKNLTVNFNRKGQIAQQAGALYAFFNASAQGTARLAQTMSGPAAKKILIGGLTLGALQAVAIAAAGYDEDEPPEFVRERNVIIPVGGERYLTIPMPLGLHVIPSTSRILTEYALSGFDDGARRVADLVGLFADAFNPIGNAGLSLQTVAPTVVDPFAALSENKDFAGRPIYREDFNKLAPTPGFTRATGTSTWWSDALSKGLNLISGGSEFAPGVVSPTPDAIDYLIEQATGGVGREISKVAQTSSSALTGEELPPYKVPLLGRFFGDASGQASEAASFYRNLREINIHEAEIKGRVAKRESATDYIAKNPDARLVRFANTLERQVRELRQAKRAAVERNAPAERVRLIEDQITARMKALNDRARAARDGQA